VELDHASCNRHKEFESLKTVELFISLAKKQNEEERIAELWKSKEGSSKRERLSNRIKKAMKYSFDQKQYEEFSSQREKLLRRLKEVQTRKLRIAFLAKPESGKSFIFNYLISGELSITDGQKVESLGPSPSVFKDGSGITGMPIWAEYGEFPELRLIRDEKSESIRYKQESKETLCKMRQQISSWDKIYRSTANSDTSKNYYVLVTWPSKWLKACNCTIIDVIIEQWIFSLSFFVLTPKTP